MGGNPLDTYHINAQQTFQEAEHLLEQAVVKSSKEWLQEWINLQIDQLLPLRGSVDEMTAVIEKAQAIVEQHSTAEQRGQFFQAVVARDAMRDRYTASEETVSYCRESLAALQQTGSKGLIGFAHFILGNRLLWSGHLAGAEQEMSAAMYIAEQIGHTSLFVRCLTFFTARIQATWTGRRGSRRHLSCAGCTRSEEYRYYQRASSVDSMARWQPDRGRGLWSGFIRGEATPANCQPVSMDRCMASHRRCAS